MDWNQDWTESPKKRPIPHVDEAERHLRHQCHDRGPCREDLANTLQRSRGEGALCAAGDSSLRCYGPSEGVSTRYGGIGLAEDSTGHLWFAAGNLYRWKPGTEAVQYFTSFEHPEVLSVA